MAEYDAVLLDLDGTLCEYVRGTRELLDASFDAVGVDPLFAPADYHELVDRYAGREDSMLALRRRCFAELAAEAGHDPELGHELANAYAAERDHSNVRPLPGTHEALDYLREHYPLGLVTNGGPTMQDQKIEGIEATHRFEAVVYAGHDVPAKPSPEPFERALSAIDAAPERAVYVGNNYEADVLGAAEAGLDAVLLGDPPADAPVEPLATIETPGELIDLF